MVRIDVIIIRYELFTYPQFIFSTVNPEGVTTDWRAVCGRSACMVRREGRRKPSLPLSTATLKFLYSKLTGKQGLKSYENK
ncbi:MAG: hypothetical protein B6D35_12500 [Candidatus Brocadia sp. UTAMX2]|jgi:hypothetical protein|nr:MAG: hypothetical protein B6D35_12500 [Candidatus Brocadia sp. UTAMX2]